jgi:hypothetical protein
MNAALRAVGSDAEAVLETNRSTNLDAYAAAVRQQALAEVVAVVEGVTLTPSLMNSRKTILTAIRALKEAR